MWRSTQLFVAFAFTGAILLSLFVARSAHAATIVDGVWSQGGAPGTTTVTFDTTSGISTGDRIYLRFPNEATINGAGTDLTVSGDGAAARTNDAPGQNIIITAGTAQAASTTVTITMTDALTAYTDTTYIQQSLAIVHNNSSDVNIDLGLAIITNTNTSTVTATIPAFLTLALDDNTMDLGVLTSGAVSTQTQQYTLNTNNAAGAIVQWTSEAVGLDDGGGNTIDDVADGAVSAGSEEYGVSLASSMTLVAPFDSGDDPLPNSVTTLANTGGAPVVNGTIDVTYKASIDAATVPGNYDEVVTVTTVANP